MSAFRDYDGSPDHLAAASASAPTDGTALDLDAIEVRLHGAMEADAAVAWRYDQIMALCAEVRSLRAALRAERERTAWLSEGVGDVDALCRYVAWFGGALDGYLAEHQKKTASDNLLRVEKILRRLALATPSEARGGDASTLPTKITLPGVAKPLPPVDLAAENSRLQAELHRERFGPK